MKRKKPTNLLFDIVEPIFSATGDDFFVSTDNPTGHLPAETPKFVFGGFFTPPPPQQET
jgi:hypothetical protein